MSKIDLRAATELAQKYKITAAAMTKLLVSLKIEPAFVPPGKRPIKYYDANVAGKLIEAELKKREMAEKSAATVADARTTAADPAILKRLEDVHTAIGKFHQAAVNESTEQGKTTLVLLEGVNSSLKGIDTLLKDHRQVQGILEVVRSQGDQLAGVQGVLEKVVNGFASSITATQEAVRTLIGETAVAHREMGERMSLLEDEISHTTEMMTEIYESLVGKTVERRVRKETSAAASASAWSAAQQAEEVAVEAKPQKQKEVLPRVALIGFLDRQHMQIQRKIKNKVDMIYISSEDKTPNLAAVRNCEKVWIHAPFISHTVQERLDGFGIRYEIVTQGAQSAAIRAINAWYAGYLEAKQAEQATE